MSSFFTLPASQRKRKRSVPSVPSRRPVRHQDKEDNESISGSDSEDDVLPLAEPNELSEDEDDGPEDEDPAAKRIRLAEQYLANAQEEVLQDGEFDAAEVDQDNLRHRMGERLKEDTAESKGKLYRWIADGLDWRKAHRKLCKRDGINKSITGIAVHDNVVYAVSKDLQLVKWRLPDESSPGQGHGSNVRAKVIGRTRGDKKQKFGQHHHQPILCLAVSPDGKFLATGGADNKLIIWSADSLKPLKVFSQHRDSVTALAFRKTTNQLFSASKDRTVKIWSLDELAYVETLFGHQDQIVDVDALAQETCVTVGARDRTARFWKVVEESQLVFRGGGAHGTMKALETLRKAYEHDKENDTVIEKGYNEGSMDRIAMIDDETFITGSDNGSLSLWSINKKKAVFTLPLAHGLDPTLGLEQASAEQEPDSTMNEMSRGGRQPRWITALKAIPFSDVFISGSWDGCVRAWKVTKDKRRIESLGAVGVVAESLDALLDNEGLSSSSLAHGALEAMRAGIEAQGPIEGIVNDLAVVDRGDRGKEGVLIAAAVGKEHRLGRWKEMPDGKNCIALFRVSPKQSIIGNGTDNVEDEDEDDFGGFD